MNLVGQEYPLEGPYTTYEGPYHIRVAIVFYHPDANDWTMAYDLQAEATAVFTNLNNAFNQHDIFFHRSEFTDCQLWYKKHPFSKPLSEIKDENANALTIIVDSDVGAAGGQNTTIPNNFTTLNGKDGTVLVTSTTVPIHEVAHLFGLFHLDGDSNYNACIDEGLCDLGVPNPPCDCCGDAVCDTPVLSGNNITSPDCMTSNHPDNPNEATIRNYMAFTTPATCRDRFTDGQAGRMWAMLIEAPVLQDMQTQVQETPASGNLPGGIYGSIVVENGTTLDINTPIEMEPASFIRVEKNALLRISATITAACDDMWQGVIVEGSTGQPQTPDKQGKVFVQSIGKIEHAKIGVDLEGLAPSSGGGLLTAGFGSQFENNEIGVRFSSYQLESSKSKLLLPQFIITDDYRGGDTQPVMIKAEGIRRLFIVRGTFKDSRTQCLNSRNQAIGVELQNASANFSSGGTFENLSTGIRANQIDQLYGSFSIGGGTFTNCLIGIHTNITSSFYISNNTFTVTKPTACPSSSSTDVLNVGVLIEGETTGFTFEGNDFQGGGSSVPSERVIGTLTRGTGEGLANVLKGNSYSLLYEGILAEGTNDGSDDGMLFLCNTFSDAMKNIDLDDPFSIHVAGGATVKNDQGALDPDGNGLIPSGNIFSLEAFTFFNNSSNADIKYHFNTNVPEERPDFTTQGYEGLELFSYTIAGCVVGPPCPNPPCPEPCKIPCFDGIIVNAWKDDFYTKRNERQTRLANLPYITNQQQLDAEQDTIRFLRQEMNVLSSKLVQQYSLDTNQVEVDSIVAWLDLAETYSTDMRLARHYLFTADFNNFDALWPQIPLDYTLSTERQSDYDELALIYNLVRPHLLAGGSVFEIGQADLDSLQFWSDWCSEPGFLTRTLLHYNGIVVEPDCFGGGITGRSAKLDEDIIEIGNTPFKIFPNPADDQLTIQLGNNIESGGTVDFFSPSGHLVFQKPFDSKAKELYIDSSLLPSGFYFVKVTTTAKNFQTHKIFINL